MKYFITTDTHFGHKKMWNTKWWRYWQSEERLRKYIEEGVTPDSILIHLWDICMWSDREVHERISKRPFKKILVRWNHDRNSLDWYMNHGRDFACDSFSINKYGWNLLFTHIPVINEKWLPKNTINIHWHFHDMSLERCFKYDFPWLSTDLYTDKYIRVALEPKNYQPKNLDKLISFIFSPEWLCKLSDITSTSISQTNGHDFERNSIGTQWLSLS